MYLNYPAFGDDESYLRYALIHEFGHSLGLEHPFEARDGDVFNGTTDPWSSAYPEDTVMAYRSPMSKSWPDFFSDNDLNALIEVWGAERQFLGDDGDQFFGNAYKDIVQGGSGNDRIHGTEGFDAIAGGPGDDELRGGPNADVVRGGSGDDWLFGGRGHDTLVGGAGDDVIRGGFGSDIFVYSAGNDLIKDFRVGEHDRLHLRADLSYELQQIGTDLRLITGMGDILIIGVNQEQLLVENLIIAG